MNYKLNPDFSYCVDVFDIKLINMKEHKQLTLKYPDAAVFALLINKYEPGKIINMISEIAHVTPKHAEGIINDTIDMLKENNVFKK
jgi:hypothetical protein